MLNSACSFMESALGGASPSQGRAKNALALMSGFGSFTGQPVGRDGVESGHLAAPLDRSHRKRS